MRGYLTKYIFEHYGLYNEMGYEESDKRGYLTFTCQTGSYIAVMAKYSDEINIYKFEKRGIITDDN